ncbi:MAG: NADH-quinone oxidoreductase subunit [Acidobacteriota bacterium]|jgi:NADH-quinone oxidoreductase subunit N|nr:NADH-quinone oxidoreductase subunit [Acidobacteriota bacterium]
MMNLSLSIVPVAPDVNIWILLPELILSVAGVVVMLIDAFTRRAGQRWVTGALALGGLGAAAVATVWLWGAGDAWAGASAYNGMVVLDPMRLSFTLVFIIVSALTVLISMIWVEWEGLPAGEFHTLLLFATVGMMLMAAGNDLVMIFLGLEILSIATYVMAGFRRGDPRSNESSLKYFILGSFSSAFLLFGIALIYGATAKEIASGPAVAGGIVQHAFMAGTTNISEIAERLNDSLYPPLLFAGAALLLIGFGFKIASAPFHVWTPDVYEGAPTPVTAFMAAGPKAAGFAAFMRVFLVAFPLVAASQQTRTGAQLHAAWLGALWLLAILTMSVGNVVALVQTNVKRMLAYSSIAHAGYALVGFVAAGAADASRQQDAVAAVVFYLLAYAVMNLGAFAVVTLIARSGDRRTAIEDYRGIGFQSPALSLTLSLFLLSLLGVPLTAGFMGKVVVFSEALGQGYRWLVIIGVLNTAISVYYYLRLVVVMFFRERTTEWHAPRIPASVALVLILTVAGVLYLGLFPGRVIDAFRSAQGSAVSLLR